MSTEAPTLICGDQDFSENSSSSLPSRSACDGLFEHGLIEFDADFADVAGLLFAEQIAAAAHVEIVAGEREAGAELSSDAAILRRFSALTVSACSAAVVR
jgi:hypothetical protein